MFEEQFQTKLSGMFENSFKPNNLVCLKNSFKPNNLVCLKNSFKCDTFQSGWLRKEPSRIFGSKRQIGHYVDANNYNMAVYAWIQMSLIR